MEKKYLVLAEYILLLSVLIILSLYPSADLAVSALFYTPAKGFCLSSSPIAVFFYQSVQYLLYITGIVIFAALLYQYVSKKELKYFTRKALLYILGVFIIGSGLIVNLGLKEHWGRARPSQIEKFGGNKHFTPAAVIADQCKHNCSFSCGHCSFAWGFISLYFLFRRRWILVLAVSYGLLVSLDRIVQGGHFLSDAFYSAVIMILTAKFLYFLIFEYKRNRNQH